MAYLPGPRRIRVAAPVYPLFVHPADQEYLVVHEQAEQWRSGRRCTPFIVWVSGAIAISPPPTPAMAEAILTALDARQAGQGEVDNAPRAGSAQS